MIAYSCVFELIGTYISRSCYTLWVALSFSINIFPSKRISKELAYIYINIYNMIYNIYTLKKKQHNLDLHTFKLPACTKIF